MEKAGERKSHICVVQGFGVQKTWPTKEAANNFVHRNAIILFVFLLPWILKNNIINCSAPKFQTHKRRTQICAKAKAHSKLKA
jgi:hypothetical protein